MVVRHVHDICIRRQLFAARIAFETTFNAVNFQLAQREIQRQSGKRQRHWKIPDASADNSSAIATLACPGDPPENTLTLSLAFAVRLVAPD
jgi:hypothetical protein